MSIVQVMFLPSKLGYLFLDFHDSVSESTFWVFHKDVYVDISYVKAVFVDIGYVKGVLNNVNWN